MDNLRPVNTNTGVEAKANETPKGGACTSLAPGSRAANAAGTSAGAGPAVARTAAKTKKQKSQIKQRTSALTGTSTDPSKTQAKTATTNTTAGLTLPTQIPESGNIDAGPSDKHPPSSQTPQSTSQQEAVTGQTETVGGTEDTFSRAWQVQKSKGKGKGTQQARCPRTDPSGPPASSSRGKQRERVTRKERRQERRLLGKGSRNKQATTAKSAQPTSGQLNFAAGKRSQAGAGTNRPSPSQPTTSAPKRQAEGNSDTQRPDWKDQAAAKRALNETSTPRGEHKRPRLDQSKRVPQKSYAQAASATLDVAITCDRTGILSREVSDQVLAAIQKQIILEACSPKPDTPGPTFNAKPMVAGGVVKLWCGNDHTLAWLRKTVSDLSLPNNISLVVKSQAEIQKRTRCGIVIPDEQGVYGESSNIGRALSYQNPWVDIKRWVLLFADKQAEQWFVVVGVPVDQIPTLMEAGRRLSIGLGAVYVKFQGRNGRFTDVPQGWDPVAGTVGEEPQPPQTPVGESSPIVDNPEASATAPALAGAAAPIAATAEAVPSSGAELDDMILSPASSQGGDGFDEGELFAGLKLEGDEEGLASDGVPFVGL